MADIATLREWLDALREARASGVRRAEFRDRTVEYKSDTEMAAAIRDLESQIAAAEGRPGIKFHTITMNRGWS
ncbi:phage head-tail joining protein [Ancylobacter terrae]|uniref:phage head-tail joining protein n=1 Tax=Ancylobacter sp. sgz301288 TaxID=3342077 RepID=UPI00385B0D7B